MESERIDITGTKDEKREKLLEQATTMPQVAKALAVFQAASTRAPYVAPVEPVIRFSTHTNN